ncbi:MAG: hypothetical protein GF311_28545, partial [Candidatus Lokiarchaeota archaeon]|nr:hypothetical protein [Candidatus Lokiarchaeota archaeon]
MPAPYSTNLGNQILNFDFNQEATSQGFNRTLKDLVPKGIFSGCTLEKTGATSIKMNAGVIFFQDSTTKVGTRIEFQDEINITVNPLTDSANPYIVIRFLWQNVQSNYAGYEKVAFLDLEDDDIILGKIEISGGSLLDTFDLTRRSNIAFLENQEDLTSLRVYPTNPESSSVSVSGGSVITSEGLQIITGATVGPFTTNATGSQRNDLVYIDKDGNILIEENFSNYNGKKVIAEIRRANGRTTVRGSEIYQIDNSIHGGNLVGAYQEWFYGNRGFQTGGGLKLFRKNPSPATIENEQYYFLSIHGNYDYSTDSWETLSNQDVSFFQFDYNGNILYKRAKGPGSSGQDVTSDLKTLLDYDKEGGLILYNDQFASTRDILKLYLKDSADYVHLTEDSNTYFLKLGNNTDHANFTGNVNSYGKALLLESKITDAFDTGTNAVVQIKASKDSGDISTRPLFSILNNATTKYSITANGGITSAGQKIISTQEDFNTCFTRVSANQYKINDSIISLYLKSLSDGYQVSGILSGGDTWGYIETNNCVFIFAENGGYFDFEDTQGYIEINTDGCQLIGVDVQGTGSVTAAVEQSFLLNASNVSYINCKTSNRNSTATFAPFRGSVTAAHNESSRISGASVESCLVSGAIFCFYLHENIQNVYIKDIESTGENPGGFNRCKNIDNFKIDEVTAVAGIIYGAYLSENISNGQLQNLTATGAGTINLVLNCTNVSNVLADTCSTVGGTISPTNRSENLSNIVYEGFRNDNYQQESAYAIPHQVGSDLNISGVGSLALAALNSTDVAFIDSSNDDLRVYRFNGSTWSQVGSDLNISGVGNLALAALNSTDVAFIDSSNDDLRVYRFNGSTWS